MEGERFSLKKWWNSVTYMQASLALLVPVAVLTVYLFVKTVRTGGGLTLADGALGMLNLVLSGIGAFTAFYGKNVLHAEARADWKWAFIPHALLFVLHLFYYLRGL